MVHWRVQYSRTASPAMDVATIHTVGPGDVIGEHGEHAVDVPRVKAIVDACEDLDVIVHLGLSLHCAGVALRPSAFTYARMHQSDGGSRGEVRWT